MPMGIVSDSEFLKELDNSGSIPSIPSTSIPTAVITPITPKGRGNGNVQVPDSLRKVIGETSEIDGRDSALDLANQFGISPSSVSAYANGSTSTATYDKQPNLAYLLKAKERISKRARVRLVQALNHITDEKLEVAKVSEVASVAKAMSAVIKDMEPEPIRNPMGGNVGPTFVFYSPTIKKEEVFDMVHVKE